MSAFISTSLQFLAAWIKHNTVEVLSVLRVAVWDGMYEGPKALPSVHIVHSCKPQTLQYPLCWRQCDARFICSSCKTEQKLASLLDIICVIACTTVLAACGKQILGTAPQNVPLKWMKHAWNRQCYFTFHFAPHARVRQNGKIRYERFVHRYWSSCFLGSFLCGDLCRYCNICAVCNMSTQLCSIQCTFAVAIPHVQCMAQIQCAVTFSHTRW